MQTTLCPGNIYIYFVSLLAFLGFSVFFQDLFQPLVTRSSFPFFVLTMYV
jgi:hypothetical protein